VQLLQCLAAPSLQQLARTRRLLPAVLAAAAPGAASDAAAAAAEAAEAAGSDEQPPLPPPPATRHQPQLSSKQRAALRAQSEGLARDKSLQRLQVRGRPVALPLLL
jgi:hypothetical protein